MKKFITLIAAIVMIATMLTGCGVDAPTADDMFKKYDTETSVSANTDKKETADDKKDEESDDKDADKKDETKSDTADKKEDADKTADNKTDSKPADKNDNASASKPSTGNSGNTGNSNASQPVVPQEKPAEPAKPAHTHSYTATVTANPTCGSAGVKTYTCSCGSSYTESIPALGHAWVAQSETVQTGTRHVAGTQSCVYDCNCGARFNSVDEWRMHNVQNMMNGDNSHGSFGSCPIEVGGYEEPVYETHTWNQCSRCGATQ